MQRGRRHPKSKNSPYYISEFRLYELIYFCLQYPEWKKKVITYNYKYGTDEWANPTEEEAIEHEELREKMKLIEKTAKNSGGEIYEYLFKAVTEDLSFTYLRTKLDMPCGRDKYYKTRDKFFYLLSQEKHTF